MPEPRDEIEGAREILAHAVRELCCKTDNQVHYEELAQQAQVEARTCGEMVDYLERFIEKAEMRTKLGTPEEARAITLSSPRMLIDEADVFADGADDLAQPEEADDDIVFNIRRGFQDHEMTKEEEVGMMPAHGDAALEAGGGQA